MSERWGQPRSGGVRRPTIAAVRIGRAGRTSKAVASLLMAMLLAALAAIAAQPAAGSTSAPGSVSPLGESWHVWGSTARTSPCRWTTTYNEDGNVTFDAAGKLTSRTLHTPWFMNDVSLLMNEDPPKVRVSLWNGQLINAQAVTVTLAADPNCTPSG